MASIVKIKYNTCVPSLSILINGTSPSEYSRLVRYMDEPIEKWASVILNDIYLELQDEFMLIFVGNELDCEIIKTVCKRSQHCIGVEFKEPEINVSVEKKLGQLNQLIKRAGVERFRKTEINAFFLIDEKYSFLNDPISKIDIKNLFCDVKIKVIESEEQYIEDEDSILFVITDKQFNLTSNIKNMIFNIYIDHESDMISVDSNIWTFKSTIEDIFDRIYRCFLQQPLVNALRQCVSSIKGNNLINRKMQVIIADEPIVIISVKKEIEEGRSVRLNISHMPEGYSLPQLRFNVNDNDIAYCDGCNVYGIKEGDFVLYAYKAGSEKPFYQKEISVFKRNRISKMVLSDDYLILGENQKKSLKLDYFPEDADNITDITWTSSNEDIVNVDKYGNLIGLSAGSCRIIVSAENVSAQCEVSVKPFLEKVQFDVQLDSTGKIHLYEFQELTINFKTFPTNSIDEELCFKTANANVCNVVGNRLFAKTRGETVLYIQNATGSVKYSFNIVVEKERKNKEGLFYKLFH